jgi:hypothetical protein
MTAAEFLCRRSARLNVYRSQLFVPNKLSTFAVFDAISARAVNGRAGSPREARTLQIVDNGRADIEWRVLDAEFAVFILLLVDNSGDEGEQQPPAPIGRFVLAQGYNHDMHRIAKRVFGDNWSAESRWYGIVLHRRLKNAKTKRRHSDGDLRQRRSARQSSAKATKDDADIEDDDVRKQDQFQQFSSRGEAHSWFESVRREFDVVSNIESQFSETCDVYKRASAVALAAASSSREGTTKRERRERYLYQKIDASHSNEFRRRTDHANKRQASERQRQRDQKRIGFLRQSIDPS